jgi:hypothetical protein
MPRRARSSSPPASPSGWVAVDELLYAIVFGKTSADPWAFAPEENGPARYRARLGLARALFGLKKRGRFWYVPPAVGAVYALLMRYAQQQHHPYLPTRRLQSVLHTACVRAGYQPELPDALKTAYALGGMQAVVALLEGP